MSPGLHLSLRLPGSQIEKPPNGDKFLLPKWACKPSQGAALHVTKNGETLSTLQLDDHTYFMFGRSPKVCAEGHGYTINHPSLSRQHAVIVHGNDETLYIIDLDSPAGTWVNKERLQPYCPKLLENANILKLGHSTRRYVVRLFPMQCKLRARQRAGSSCSASFLTEANLNKLRVSTPRRSGAGCAPNAKPLNAPCESLQSAADTARAAQGDMSTARAFDLGRPICVDEKAAHTFHENAKDASADASHNGDGVHPDLTNQVGNSNGGEDDDDDDDEDDDDDDEDEDDEAYSPCTRTELRQRKENLRQARLHSGLNAAVSYPSPKSMLGRRGSDSPVSSSISAAELAAAVAATSSPVASPVMRPQPRRHGSSGLTTTVETFARLPPSSSSSSSSSGPAQRARSLSTSSNLSGLHPMSMGSPRESVCSVGSTLSLSGSHSGHPNSFATTSPMCASMLLGSPTLQVSQSLPTSTYMSALSLDRIGGQPSDSPEIHHSRADHPHGRHMRQHSHQLMQRSKSPFHRSRSNSTSATMKRRASSQLISHATQRRRSVLGPCRRVSFSQSGPEVIDADRMFGTDSTPPRGAQHLCNTAFKSIGLSSSSSSSKNNNNNKIDDGPQDMMTQANNGESESAPSRLSLAFDSDISTSSNMSERICSSVVKSGIMETSAFLPRVTSMGNSPCAAAKRRSLERTPSAQMGVSPDSWPTSPAALRGHWRNPHSHVRSNQDQNHHRHHRHHRHGHDGQCKEPACTVKLHEALDNICEEFSPSASRNASSHRHEEAGLR
ncbi:Nuclear inhibitor of protein phosphatase 1 [Hondaea fermentalgiana]|uniref:Nuclear inhibitor of protein phosphatase 1 n=1 Tax=Hondaea fermentalgiana TaxID=2315210 RepID=A0A2R5GLR8_9STRA|nr:Nuclear inhibitor of protein phosphatase 1 [Hondaea fermentalgiana]|eukprot:GBG29231.1 Nuclear inhibitor of protein phosphatase 1 [Hondaea fermentalgiana]